MTIGPNLMFENLRVEVLLKNVASKVFREVFERRYKRSTNYDWEDGAGRSKQFLISQSKGIKWMKIQKGKIEKGDLKSMDVAQLGQLLKQFRWHTKATTSNITEDEIRALEQQNKLVDEITKVRNSHAHMSNSSKNKDGVEELLKNSWENARAALLELGGESLADEIDEIKDRDFAGLSYSDAALSEENMAKARTLKDEGNFCVREGNLEKAIDCYTQALELEGLSHVELGILYSNRCHANLLMSENNSLPEDHVRALIEQALDDARFIIVEQRPSWWKGYYRAAQVYKRKKEFKPALISCDQALNLLVNKEETEVISKLRNEINQLAEVQGMTVDSSPDRPTEASVLRDLKKYSSKFGILLPETNSLSAKVDKLLTSAGKELLGFGAVLKGHCYFYGLGDHQQDIETGAKFYTKAVMKLNALGFYYSGLCHLTGQGVPMDPVSAVGFLENATEDPEVKSVAMCALGKFYEAGQGKVMPQDFNKAATWYSSASDAGNGEASNLLAILYDEGKGVPQNKVKAMEYWIIAAEQGYESAMERLAMEYLKAGKFDEAEIWFSKAIDTGCLSAFLNKTRFEEMLQNARFDSRQQTN